MERRSRRGGDPVPAPVPAEVPSEVPEGGSDEVEVVLNRRGMPARQRKKNRLYFDEEVMITETPSKGKQKKVKSEPVDEDEDETITGDLPFYGGDEVEIPSAVVEEEVVASSSKGRGRPSTSKRMSAPPPKSPSRSPVKQQRSPTRSPVKTAPTSRGRQSSTSRDSSTSKDRRDSSSRHSSPKGSSKKDASYETLEQQRYLEKKEKDRLAKERERERKRMEREYAQQSGSSSGQRRSSSHGHHSRRERETSPDFGLGGNGLSGSGLMSSLSSLNVISSLDDFKQTIDKKTAQDISLRLRNLLKLPKAHKWVCYEWFYSNIDKVLFEGENDFQTCLRESFPLLKARKLTRVEWCKIRRIMGKPRRCSQAFFDEEREELARRRQKIRMIQQRKITDFNYKELPDEIPLQLTIGTKVTARLRRPQDGLFTGTIEGVDTSNNTSRITFDRAGLGTHSIPDYEVLSNDPIETVSTSSFALKIPRRAFGFGTAAFKFQNPGLIGEDGLYRFPTSPFPEGGMLGGFPIRLLDMIVRLSKLLKSKREKILSLKELNVEAEKMMSYGKPFNTDYRLRYARCVLDLDSMNKEMAMYVEGIQTYCLEQILPDHGANNMIVPEQIQDQCKQEASLIVETCNSKGNRRAVQNPKSLQLISNLTSLMLQVKTLSTGERNLYELKSIKETIKDTKASLEGKNLQFFQNKVEIPMNRIQAGLCIYTKPF